MNNEEIRKKEEIESALAAMIDGDFLETSKHLLAVLGYCSERTAELPGTADDFIQRFPARNRNTETEAEFIDSVESVELVFQITSDEIAPSDQPTLFESPAFDEGYVRSFTFFAIELKDSDYPRGKYAQFTREVNKRMVMPIVVFFRVKDRLTIGFVGRRQHRRDPDRDVLEQVTLIKDIRLDKAHRAHIDILFELWLEECANWMADHNKPENFDGLLAAWLARLDTSELNKRFFNELANWYFWAVDQVKFPEDAGEDVEVRNATSVIRLLTRLIFVWFIKEKGLVPDALFNPNDLEDILDNLDPQAGTYYKAILQNLFFATLNQEMNTPQNSNNRKFRGEGRQHYNITSLYRYKDYFIDPDEALRKFETIPFLNGGLFECLDTPSKEDAKIILRVDGFSDRNDNPLHVPNELFFSEEQSVDLNDAYDTRDKRYKVRGLIHILSSYKFTIAENTPIEEEVALDPELLGKVFENLLAAYNPETEATARKQTGSYYTPRQIVNYMTDESLIAYLKNELITYSEVQRSPSMTTPAAQLDLTGQAAPVQTELSMERALLSDEQKVEIEKKLRELFAYNDEPHPFDEAEIKVLIRAIDTLKILDPAAGSGAFPMGVLHRLVFILGKLDPRNEQWKQRQIDRVENTITMAEEIDDSTIRESTIRDLEGEIESINEAFERNELDYGRKLYLIENCIYGVDIQSIATQIAKLRFFISLIVDQQIDDSRENRGVRPLPNLETKFVAANTLLSVDKPLQMQIRNPQIERKEKELEDVRRRHFTARTPRTKAKYRDLDTQIRTGIGKLLKDLNFPDETTEKIAHWDPYNQNASADWFDPEWMFGVRDGFDVVIGNPPYGAKINPSDLNKIKANAQNTKNSNSAALFIDYAKNRLTRTHRQGGIVAFIVPKSLLYSEKWHELAFSLLEKTTILVDVEKAFEKVKLEQVVFIYSPQCENCFYVGRKFLNNAFVRTIHIDRKYPTQFQAWICDVSSDDIKLGSKVANTGTYLRDISKTTRGLSIQKNLSTRGDIEVIGGKEVSRYGIVGVKGFVNREDLDLTSRKIQFLLQPKVISQRLVAHIQNPKPHIKIISTVDKAGDILNVDTVENTIIENKNFSPIFISSLFNSTLINWYAYRFIFCCAIRTMDFDNYYVGKIPVPAATFEQQAPMIELFNQILAAKGTDPDADVSELENEIDQIVYLLYGLTPEEIAIVEGAENV